MRCRSSWHDAARLCLLAWVMVACLLCPHPARAHGSEFVYVRLQKLQAHENTWAIRASLEYLDNPLAPDEAAARLALTSLFTVTPPDSAPESSAAQQRTPPTALGPPQWTTHTTWADASTPVPMPEAMEDGRAHRWLTALWTLNLPPEHATASLHISTDTKLGVVWWEVEPTSATPGDAIRWQILLPGDKSFEFGVPAAAAPSTSSPVPESRDGWLRGGIFFPIMLGAMALFTVIATSAARRRRRSRQHSKAESNTSMVQAG